MHRMLKNYCTSIFQIFGWIICVETVFEYRIHLVYSIKMKFLTYTSHNENFGLYTQIHCKVVVNSCQIKFARKDIILPSDAAVILCFSGIADVRPIYIYIKFAPWAGIILLIIFIWKSRYQFHNKVKTGKHLKLMT